MQDERRRQYLGRLPHLQPNYCGPVSVAELDTSKLVFATFTNAAPVYVEQLLNWAFHLRELQLPHVVVCLDNESEDIAVSNGIPFVTVQNKTTSEDVRNDHATFRAMVSRKVCALLCVLGCELATTELHIHSNCILEILAAGRTVGTVQQRTFGTA